MANTDTYDVIIIGSGPAGYVAAIFAAQSGLRTLVVEKDDDFGGTCLLRGCIPTKALLESAHLYEKIQHASQYGISVDGVSLDLASAHAFKDKVIRSNVNGVKFLFKKNKVKSVQGWGELIGGKRVRVTPDSGRAETYEARLGVILATGSSCKHLPFFTVDHDKVIDSDDILEISEIPKKLIVLGAGAVGTEFASIFHRFGSKTTLIEVLPRILPFEDDDVSVALEKSLKRQGMRVLTETRVENVRSLKSGVKVKVRLKGGGAETLSASHLLVATGRQPNTEGVGLENTAIVVDKRGFVEVDDYMQTAEPGVYAIGDIIPTAMLAHLGSHEGVLAVDHMAGKNPHPINADRVPACTYCDPEVASVGLTEREARNRGYDVKTAVFPFTANAKAKILGETAGFVKLVGEKQYDEVLGAHIIGPHATDLIAGSVVGLNLETTAEELANSIHPHPTVSEAMGEAAHALFHGQPLHF